MKENYRGEYIRKLSAGGALYGRDVLSAMLSNAFGGKDMTAVADGLLARFPSVGAVLHASVEELTDVDGVSERMALYLIAVGRLENYNPHSPITEIKSAEHFRSCISTAFEGCDNEYAQFYLVNARGKVVAQKRFTSMRAETVSMPTEDFLAFLTGHKAYGLYCAHNHVADTCRPSRADDVLTEKIARLCEINGVKFFEHAIVDCRGNVFGYSLSGGHGFSPREERE